MNANRSISIPYLSPCTKLKSKWIKDLNVTPATLKLFEDNVGSSLECVATGDQFLNITPVAETLRATIKFNFAFLICLWFSKGIVRCVTSLELSKCGSLNVFGPHKLIE